MDLRKHDASKAKPVLGLCITITLVLVLFSCSNGSSNVQRNDSFAAYKEILNSQWKLLAEEDNLVSEIELLTNHPGWGDFTLIIKAAPSIAYLEGEEASLKKTKQTITSWSEKWNAPGEELYRRYLVLASRSKALYTKRVDLYGKEIENIESNHREGLKIAAQTNDSNIAAQMEQTENEFRGRSLRRASVMNNIFGIGPLGLYERRISKEEARRRLASQ